MDFPYRFTKRDDEPKPRKKEHKQAKPKRKPVKREPEPDYYQPVQNREFEPVKEVFVRPITMPVFLDPVPGVGQDVMDALMATLAALDVPDSETSLPIGSPEEDLELVLLADEITD